MCKPPSGLCQRESCSARNWSVACCAAAFPQYRRLDTLCLCPGCHSHVVDAVDAFVNLVLLLGQSQINAATRIMKFSGAVLSVWQGLSAEVLFGTTLGDCGISQHPAGTICSRAWSQSVCGHVFKSAKLGRVICAQQYKSQLWCDPFTASGMQKPTWRKHASNAAAIGWFTVHMGGLLGLQVTACCVRGLPLSCQAWQLHGFWPEAHLSFGSTFQLAGLSS